MGIVNLTGDSYFSPSRCLDSNGKTDVGKVLGKIGTMLEEGADIIDIGACSTRPGSAGVGIEEEWRRLAPVIDVLGKEFPGTAFSIDTYFSEIVRRVYENIGKFIVNDISAGEDDEEMLGTVGRLDLEYVAMHKKGKPENMQDFCDYTDVAGEVAGYFEKFAGKAEKAGIRNWILDPGIGFSKTIAQNYELIKNLGTFRKFGKPILVGVSRKSMIYKLLGGGAENALNGTTAIHAIALMKGANLLRVHDVKAAVETVRIFNALQNQ